MDQCKTKVVAAFFVVDCWALIKPLLSVLSDSNRGMNATPCEWGVNVQFHRGD
jgi:hypothetical protein